MRFEKINENKLKIELTKEDLIAHNIKISDIAFGSDNSRKLLHDIMAQAFEELNFEPDNLPLVIEAVPTSGFSINIFITKIQDENELEENLGKVAKQNEKNLEGLNLLEKFTNEFEQAFKNKFSEKETGDNPNQKELASNKDGNKSPSFQQKSILEKTEIIYKFVSLDDVIDLSHVLKDSYTGKTILYKHEDVFYLFLNARGYEKVDVVKLRLTLDEFGDFVSTHKVAQGFLNEHGMVILKSDVFKKLGKVSNS